MTPHFVDRGEWSIVAATVWEPQRAWIVSLNPHASPMAPMLVEGSAFHIWRLAQEVTTTAALVESLAHEFDVEPAELEGDVATFLDQLIDQGLLARGDQRAQGR